MRHGHTAAIHTDLQSGCGRTCVFAVWALVELVRSNLAPDFPLFHGAGCVAALHWQQTGQGSTEQGEVDTASDYGK